MKTLLEKHCVFCEVGTDPLASDNIKKLANQIDPSWRVIHDHHLLRVFKFKNFAQALKFTNQIGELAETEGHHPNICLGWSYVKVKLSTHNINGLSENDFILAAKIDEIK